ncbi:porin [Hydromonas duriensis]|uniref:Putative porin n=1 Tax=Hydromonas duriensis TaxID=1527608 RepID=A0A4R6YAM3_9BURK|nr:porin [Hydromonas duriensis]TDR32566.1 putative porin [Hydromonas duriensis]
MKKSLITLAILSTAVSAAHAASNVTLYGRFDIGYLKKSDTSLQQVSGGDVRLGLKGSEDLGNGMSATFQLEGRFDGDTGAKSSNRTFFDRESTVGIKGAFGHVRFGRSISAFEQGISYIDIGRRSSAHSVYNENYGVATRHSNAMFYNYSAGAFSGGFDVTTKGGYNDGVSTSEGNSGTKAGWGAFAKYKANGLEAGVAYQDDGVQTAKKIRKEWGIGVAYTFKPVTVGLSYAAGKDDVVGTQAKLKNYGGYIQAALTADDSLMAMYRREELKNKNTTTGIELSKEKITHYGLGYVHNLSKRTSVYTDIARIKKDTTGTTSSSSSYTSYDIGIRHYF